MGAAENKLVVSNFINEIINKGNIESAGDYVADDLVELVPFPGQGPGLAGLQDVLRGMHLAFPDLHWAIEEQIAESDQVLTRFIWTGTHKGEFLNVPPTGNQVSVWGMVIDQLKAGKIQETQILMDTLGLKQQLGALPA